MKHLDQLDNIFDQYDTFFCDVWGVLHNGIHVFPKPQAALKKARKAGKHVVLITNSPRPSDGVAKQLADMGLDPHCYDDIVTSGDVSRDLISMGPKKLFLIGPDRDLNLFDGLDCELVEEFEANSVVVTGLYNDETETPDDYADLLQRLRMRNLPMICANPDIMVERGDKLLWCAGALARNYGNLGGRILIAGKPHQPIYEVALKKMHKILGHQADSSKILVIGDGVLTDIKGGVNNGFDTLYIARGIHANEYLIDGKLDKKRLEDFFVPYSLTPTFTMMELE